MIPSPEALYSWSSCATTIIVMPLAASPLITSRTSAGAFPQVGERPLRVFLEGRGDLPDIIIERAGVQHGVCLVRMGWERRNQGKRHNCRGKTFHWHLATVLFRGTGPKDEPQRGV
jgi:hypothetical protein